MFLLLPFLNFWLAVAGLILAAITIVLAVDLFIYKGKYFSALVHRFFWVMTIGATVGSVGLSLLYSEYFGFIPCSLCWLQRIAIYPQALMSLVAWKVRDHIYFPMYGIALSLFGLVVAIYQYIYQMMPRDSAGSGLMPCLADGSNADCAVKVIDQFGFVSFPLLSAITFVFLIVIYLYVLRTRSTQGTV